MPDYFALLNQPRRPWLDLEALKATFLSVSAQLHPDRTHGASAVEKEATQQRYAEVNAAYQCLQSAKDRIRHLLLVETGDRIGSIQNAPPEMMDTFMAVGKICHEADQFLGNWSRATSPLVKAQMFASAQQLRGRLQELQGQLGSMMQSLENELRELDARWEENSRAAAPQRTELLQQLQTLYQRLSYVGRWTAQVNERIVRLSI